MRGRHGQDTTLRLLGCARKRTAQRVRALRENSHGAHRRAGGGLGVETSEATGPAAEVRLLRVVRVKVRSRASGGWGKLGVGGLAYKARDGGGG